MIEPTFLEWLDTGVLCTYMHIFYMPAYLHIRIHTYINTSGKHDRAVISGMARHKNSIYDTRVLCTYRHVPAYLHIHMLYVHVKHQVSMIEPTFLEWLDTRVREIRSAPNEVFGGMQVIFVGDFCQVCMCVCVCVFILMQVIFVRDFCQVCCMHACVYVCILMQVIFVDDVCQACCMHVCMCVCMYVFFLMQVIFVGAFRQVCMYA
jgi:hypothetical protein